MKQQRVAGSLFICLICAALILSCTGCSLNDETAIATPYESPAAAIPPDHSPSSDAADSGSEPPAGPDAVESAAPAGESPSADPATDAPADSAGETDYTLLGETLIQSDGIGAIRINMTESELISAVGEPKATSMPAVWGADGLVHSEWNYEDIGLIINMTQLPDGDDFIVFSIKAFEPCALRTKLGVGIGDTKNDVLSAYEKEYNAEESDENALVLGTIYGGMVITLDEGAVVEIFVGAAAE